MCMEYPLCKIKDWEIVLICFTKVLFAVCEGIFLGGIDPLLGPRYVLMSSFFY